MRQYTFNKRYPSVEYLIEEFTRVLIRVFDDRVSDMVVNTRLHYEDVYGFGTDCGRVFLNPFQYYNQVIEDYFGEKNCEFSIEGPSKDVWRIKKRFLEKIQFKESYRSDINRLICPLINSPKHWFVNRCGIAFFISVCKSWTRPLLVGQGRYFDRIEFYENILYNTCKELTSSLVYLQMKEYDDYPPDGKVYDAEDLKYDSLVKIDDTICDTLFTLKDGTALYPLETGLSGGLYDYYIDPENCQKFRDLLF